MTSATARRLAAVTGASSGIGYELAKRFAEHGYDVVMAAEDERIEAAARDVAALGRQAEAVRVDLATYAGVEEFYSRILADGRPLDAVAINAGIGVGGPFADTSLADELRLVDLNVRSAVHLAKRCVQEMAPRRAGRILFTSSITANQPGPFEASFAAAEAFLLSFSEGLRDELKDQGITVTALLPGPTGTEFFDRAGMADTRVGSGRKDSAAQVAAEGFEALMKGKDRVLAGSLKDKVMAGAAKVTPETVRARMHRAMSEPGSGEK